jgi:hypothetical protein
LIAFLERIHWPWQKEGKLAAVWRNIKPKTQRRIVVGKFVDIATKLNVRIVDPGSDAEIGITDNSNASAISGLNKGNKAMGFLAGQNPLGNTPVGAYGESESLGVFGFAKTAQAIGVAGNSANGAGIGVQGHTSTNIGVLGSSDGIGLAGKFIGNIEVTGHINCHETSKITCFDVSLIGGDCAEEFNIVNKESVEPGTVMVIDNEDTVLQSNRAYDKRVAGVISGAGNHNPGIVLDKRQTRDNRMPIALVGKVYCKVDTQYSPIEVGDLLTKSPTPGHAMKADDPLKAFGAVIGKALRSLAEGQGLIPILIALQ